MRFRNGAFAMNYVATPHMERHEWQEARDFAQQMEEIERSWTYAMADRE